MTETASENRDGAHDKTDVVCRAKAACGGASGKEKSIKN